MPHSHQERDGEFHLHQTLCYDASQAGHYQAQPQAEAKKSRLEHRLPRKTPIRSMILMRSP
ncbi:hypothetical protein RRSWK_03892 [Rhodopirellula sp. SWK7]|nr:hypothetical protein RRSWK_03892 [Rhodopirellula sp. SWK7]